MPGLEEAGLILRVVLFDPPGASRRLVAARDTAGPAGEIDGARETVPENPFRLLRVMVDVPEDPWPTERAEGFAVMLKADILHAETGWNSHPVKLCQVVLM